MLHQFCQKLYEETIELIKSNGEQGSTDSQKLSSTLNIIKKSLHQLKEYVLNHPFSDDMQEIDFFKHIKPKFYSRLIFYVELFNIEKDKPCGLSERVRNYYSNELDLKMSFFKRNQFLYDYYHLKMNELDNHYFLRNADTPVVVLSEIPEANPEFSTSCDYLFSKFIAYEDLCAELLQRINRLIDGTEPLPSDQSKHTLRWTGDKVNIAELAYGLFYTGQINGGECDVADIIAWLEESLNLKMGSVHRKFIDIRRRKTISYTKFLDSMRDAINKRIDEDLTYKPNRGIKLINPPNSTNNKDLK